MYKLTILLVLAFAPVNAWACPAGYGPCGMQNQLCCPI
jgi:hypothetical protein